MLKDIESPYEVHDYIKNYLGDSKQVQTFAQQFLEKRSKLKNAAKPKHEDGLWGPTPALNPLLARQQASARQQQQQQQQQKQTKSAVSDTKSAGQSAGSGGGANNGGGGVGKKKKRMQKVDNSVLGFTVIADPGRTNAGELDKI